MIEIVISVLGNLLVICYFAYLLPPRFSNKFILVIPLVILIAGDMRWFYQPKNLSLTFFIGITLLFICLCFFKNMKSGIFYLLILETMMLVADVFVYYLAIMICDIHGLILEDIPNYRFFLFIPVTILWPVFSLLCAQKFKTLQNFDIPKLYWFYFSAIPVCSIYLAFYVMVSFEPDSALRFGFPGTLIAIAAMNIINIHLYSASISYYATKLANQTLMERVHLSAQKQNDLVEAYKNLRTMQHDMKNNLMPILTAISENEYAAADEKIREMIGAADLDIFVSSTGINFIDDMINYKASIAREKNVDINVVSEMNEVLNLDYFDISSVIGTALDNAIEACLKNEKDRTVDICVTSGVGLFMVKISNPRNGDIHTDGADGFLSTKPDSEKHGFGLVSIKKLVEKNGGALRIEYPDGRFEISAVFHEDFS